MANEKQKCSDRATGHHAYNRLRDLPALLPVWPAELTDMTTAGHAALIAKLRRALRRERQHGIAGHWTYDLQRHAALLRAYRSEVESYLARRRAMATDAEDRRT